MPLNRTIALGQWNEVKVHVVAAGARSTIEVWFNGMRVYSNAAYVLPTSSLTTVLLGSEHVAQQIDLRFDDVVIHAS